MNLHQKTINNDQKKDNKNNLLELRLSGENALVPSLLWTEKAILLKVYKLWAQEFLPWDMPN